jgi:RNA polymerase sigma-70 factor (ECF subfamily)
MPDTLKTDALFTTWYEAYREKVFRLCMGYLNDEEQAADLTQDIFMTVYRQISNFRNEASPGTWIYRIAVNKCLRHIQQQNRNQPLKLAQDLEDAPSDSKEDRISLLYKLIAQLPELDRIIISLELEEIKQAEIARITGLGESNIRVRIHRIKEKLHQEFLHHESI